MHDANEVLARNLRALMIHHDMIWETGEPNQSALARETGIAQRSAGRLLNQENSATLDMVNRICARFDLEAWQLLATPFDPADPPNSSLTKSERAFFDQVKQSFGTLVKKL